MIYYVVYDKLNNFYLTECGYSPFIFEAKLFKIQEEAWEIATNYCTIHPIKYYEEI